MKKISMLLCAATAFSFFSKANAQVDDVNVIVAPTAQYTWWDSNLSLNNTPFWGVHAGFGFGPIVEIRALYEHSYDLKGNLKRIDWQPAQDWAGKLQDSKATIQRYGGEVKLNLVPVAILSPYITAGTGIMRFSYSDAIPNQTGDNYKEAQLYGSVGAGLKVNLSKRVVLSLEGKNTFFNLNKNNRYRNPGIADDKILQNWSAGAGLDFYFGGNDYSDESEISRAYRNMFSSGFNGMTFSVEPGLMYVDFDKNSKFSDQVFMGGSAGIDFTPLIGLRGFYYQATQEPDKVQFKYNRDMKMYGGNLVARLNFPRGVTPYLTLGAGYLDVSSQSYNANTLKSGYFAFGGAGLELPLFKSLALYGHVNAMVNQQDNPDVKNITTPSDVTLNMMYTAGLRFNFGSSSSNGESLYKSYLQKELAAQKEYSQEEINFLRADNKKQQERYERRLAALNDKLAEAALRHDSVAVVKVLKEKKAVEYLENNDRNNFYSRKSGKETIALTPDQFEELVKSVVREIESKESKMNSSSQSTSSLTDLDKILLINALQHGQLSAPNFVAPSVNSVSNDTKETEALLGRMLQLLDKMDLTYTKMMTMNALQNQKSNQEVLVAPKGNNLNDSGCFETPMKYDSVDTHSETIHKVGFYGFNKLAILGGYSYANGSRANLGVRGYMPISNTHLDFVPELLVGFGHSTEFDLSANVVYNFDFSKLPVVPYLGVGIGYFSALSGVKSNVIAGVSFKNILNGNLFVDYSARGVFSENLISVGYRFAF